MNSRRNALADTYYLVALTLLVVGFALRWSGHGSGTPYWSLGGVMAGAPGLVTWLREKLHRGQMR